MADKFTPSKEDKTISEEAIAEKLAASMNQLSRAECITVLQTQRDHDAALEEQEEAAAEAAAAAEDKAKKAAAKAAEKAAAKGKK